MQQIQVNMAFTADTAQARAQLQSLQQQLNNLSSATNLGGQSLPITSELLEAQNAATSLKIALEGATNVNTGKLDLSKFNQSLKSSGQTLSSYSVQLAKLGPAGEQAFANLTNAIIRSDAQLRRTSGLADKFFDGLKRTAGWQIQSTIIHAFNGSIQTAFGYAQDLNKSLNNIRIVTGQSVDQMARFAKEANRAAKSLSTTTTEYTNASLIYYQQGLSDQEVKNRTDITIKAANAAGVATSEMADYLTAVWNSYGVAGAELERYVDIMAAVGAGTATSLEEISTSMEKVASVGAAVGVEFEQMSSIIATVSSVTRQSAESIGTSYKTIFARMADLKLGKADEDGIGLGQVSSQLAQVGVNILDETGNLRDMGVVLDELMAKWNNMNQATQQAVAIAVAGKRQYTNFLALMNNQSMYRSTLGIAEGAEGTLDQQAEIYAQSWEAASKRVKTSAQTIYDALINDETMIDALGLAESFLNSIGGIIKGLGGLSGVLTGLGSIATQVFSKQIAQGIDNFVFNVKSRFGIVHDEMEQLRQEAMRVRQEFYQQQGGMGGNTALTFYGQQDEMQDILLRKTKDLNEEQQRYAQTLLDTANNYSRVAIESNQSLDAQINSVNALEKAIGRTLDKTAQQQVADGLKQSLIGARNENLSVFGDTLFGKNSNIQEELQKVQTQIQQVEGAAKSSGLTLEQYLGNAGAKAVKTIKQELEQANPSADKIQDQFRQLGSISNTQLTQASQVINNVVQKLREMNTTTSNMQADRLEQIFGDIVEGAQNADRASQNAVSGLDKLKQKMLELQKQPATLGQSMTALANVMTSLAFTIQSIQALGSIWKNEDLSTGEKILSTLMQMGFLLNSLLNLLKLETWSNIAQLGMKLLSIDKQEIKTIIAKTKAKLEEAKARLKNAAAKKVESSEPESGETPVSTNGKGFGGLKNNLKGIGAMAAIAAAAAFAGWAVNKSSDILSKEEDSYAASQELLSNLQTQVQETENQYNNLNMNLQNFDDQYDKIQNLTKGTQEWKDEVYNLNNSILDLLDSYNMLNEANYYRDADGVIHLTKEAENKIQQNARITMISSKMATQIQKEQVALDKQRLQANKLAEKSTVNEDLSMWGMAATGAAIGAVAGSYIPVLGNVVGGIVGGLVGLGAGALGGSAIAEAQQNEDEESWLTLGRLYAEHGMEIFSDSELTANLDKNTKALLESTQKNTENAENLKQQLIELGEDIRAGKENERVMAQQWADSMWGIGGAYENQGYINASETGKRQIAEREYFTYQARVNAKQYDLENKTDEEIAERYAKAMGEGISYVKSEDGTLTFLNNETGSNFEINRTTAIASIASKEEIEKMGQATQPKVQTSVNKFDEGNIYAGSTAIDQVNFVTKEVSSGGTGLWFTGSYEKDIFNNYLGPAIEKAQIKGWKGTTIADSLLNKNSQIGEWAIQAAKDDGKPYTKEHWENLVTDTPSALKAVGKQIQGKSWELRSSLAELNGGEVLKVGVNEKGEKYAKNIKVVGDSIFGQVEYKDKTFSISGTKITDEIPNEWLEEQFKNNTQGVAAGSAIASYSGDNQKVQEVQTELQNIYGDNLKNITNIETGQKLATVLGKDTTKILAQNLSGDQIAQLTARDTGTLSTQALKAMLKEFGKTDEEIENIGINWDELDKKIKTSDIPQSIENINKALVTVGKTLQSLGGYWSEFQEKGYLSFESIENLRTSLTNLGFDSKQINAYTEALMNGTMTTAEFNDVLSQMLFASLIQAYSSVENLADANEELIAKQLKEKGVLNATEVAHEMVTRAKAKEAAMAVDVTEATETEIEQYLTEAAALGYTREQALGLYIQEQILNNSTLNTAQKVEALLKVAAAANLALKNYQLLSESFTYTDKDGKKTTYSGEDFSSGSMGADAIRAWAEANKVKITERSEDDWWYEYTIPDTNTVISGDTVQELRLNVSQHYMSNVGSGIEFNLPDIELDTSGGGGSSTPDPKELDDEIERYQKINEQLEINARAQRYAQDALNKAYGPDKLAAMDKYIAKLKEENDLLDSKQDLAIQYAKSDRANLQAALSAMGFSKDQISSLTALDNTQHIANQDLLIATMVAQANANLSNEGVQQAYEDAKKFLGKYTESIDMAQDLEIQMWEKRTAIQEQNLERIKAEYEEKKRIYELDKERLQFEIDMLNPDVFEYQDEILFRQAKQIELSLTQDFTNTMNEISDLEAAFYRNDISKQGFAERLNKLVTEAFETFTNAQEFFNSYSENFLNVFEMSNEQIETQTALIDGLKTALTSLMNLYKLQNKGANFENTEKFLKSQANAQKELLGISQEVYATRKALLAAEEEKLKTATGTFKQQQEKIVEDLRQQTLDAYTEMLAKGEEYAETLAEILRAIFDELGKQLAEALVGDTFENLNKEMEHLTAVSEHYLTETNKVYETNKMIRTAEIELSNTQNKLAQQRLQSFIQETAQLQQQGKLSNFELEVQQAKYDLLVAQIALEDAQNAKNQVRLARDSRGNFNYIYTADQNEIAKATQEVEDAENNLYNVLLEGANDYRRQMIEIYQNYADEIADLESQLDEGLISKEEFMIQASAARERAYKEAQMAEEAYTQASTLLGDKWKEAWVNNLDDSIASSDKFYRESQKNLNKVEQAVKDFDTEVDKIIDLDEVDQDLGNIDTAVGNLALTIKQDLLPALTDMVEKLKKIDIEKMMNVFDIQKNAETGAGGKLANAQDIQNSLNAGTEYKFGQDLSRDILTATIKGGSSVEDLESTFTARAERIWALSEEQRSNLVGNDDLKKLIWNYGYNDAVTAWLDDILAGNSYLGVDEAIRRGICFTSLDTGGYTGEWGNEGRLAMLHQKELVLNENDTANFLAAMGLLDKIIETIDLRAANAQLSMMNITPAIPVTPSSIVEQYVRIEAHFPDVTSADEIEAALNNLVNDAYQHASIRKD